MATEIDFGLRVEDHGREHQRISVFVGQTGTTRALAGHLVMRKNEAAVFLDVMKRGTQSTYEEDLIKAEYGDGFVIDQED